MQDVSWNDLRYVLAVARTGTLSSAAARLRVDPTTVSRRIGRAALILGSRLFYRSGGMLVPTEAGQLVLAHAERIEFEVDRLKNTVADADTAISGSVRVTSVPILVNRVLIPALPELHNKYPMLQLELIADATNLSLNRRDADIAVRLARPHKEQSVVARRWCSGRRDERLAACLGSPTSRAWRPCRRQRGSPKRSSMSEPTDRIWR